jgi:hypothetical protein
LRVIIAGSRTIRDFSIVEKAINDSQFEIDEVVSGGYYGVDQLGERWAKNHDIPVKRFPADWDRHGRAAGLIRNSEMAEYADALIAVQGKNSKGENSHGTKDMIWKAKKNNLDVFVVEV